MQRLQYAVVDREARLRALGRRRPTAGRTTAPPHRHRDGAVGEGRAVHRSTTEVARADTEVARADTAVPDLAAAAPPAALDELLHGVAQRRRTAYERFAKFAIDWMVALLLTTLLLPLLIVIAGVVLFSLGSPILIRQPRVGRQGRVFHMYKFRTMRPDRRKAADPTYSGPERRLTHKSPSDPRHTPIGRRLRSTSLDELPQLFNVLRGDMSLIGPRPELNTVVAGYHAWQHTRHLVKPGITGYWQVTERANGTLLHERIDLDLVYISQLSFRSDLQILLSTPRALLRRGNVH